MKVYLCGGINGLTDAQCNDWRTYAKKKLKADILDPMRRDYRGKEDGFAKEIVEEDLRDIQDSDFILANCARPSWGTAMEIRVAHSMRCPVVSVVPKGPVSPWLRYHSTLVCKSLDEAIVWINGKVV